jgi:hypothetical protein
MRFETINRLNVVRNSGKFWGIALATLLVINGCEDELPKECPFKPLPVVREVAVIKEKQLKFATEIDARIALLRNKIGTGIKPSMLMEYGEVIDRYQREVLCPDPAFVGYYNALQNIVCGKWELYRAGRSDHAQREFDLALAHLQEFIAEYYRLGQMKNYRDAFEFVSLDGYFTELKREIVSLEARYPDEISKIRLGSYREKIKVIELKAAQIKLEDTGRKTLDYIKTLRTEVQNLRDELHSFNNNNQM